MSEHLPSSKLQVLEAAVDSSAQTGMPLEQPGLLRPTKSVGEEIAGLADLKIQTFLARWDLTCNLGAHSQVNN